VAQESTASSTSGLIDGLGADELYGRATGGAVESLLTDALGSTIALADGEGAIGTEYTYSPYGAATSTGSSSSNPFQYTGRENDGDGLQYNRARYYDPTTGRFISQDPLGGGGSGADLYTYADDSPVNMIDPSGMVATPSPHDGEGPGGGGAASASSGSGAGAAPGGASPGASDGGVGATLGLPGLPGPGGSCPGPGSHSSGGAGLWEKIQCTNFKPLEEAEEEVRLLKEREEDEESREKVLEVGTACGLGGAPSALAARGIAGGPEAVAAGATFCTGYAAGSLIVRPVLHKIFPGIFPE
jgi:RHS repeat-associated protein